EATFLVAAKRAARIEFVISVRPNDAGPQFRGDFENLAAFLRPHPGAQAKRRVVGAHDCLLGSAKSHYAQDRSENLLLSNAMRRGYTGEKAWRIPVTALRQAAAWLHQLRAFPNAALHQL